MPQKKELIQQRIERLRVAAGLDRHQLAARCGRSYTAIWNWETKGTETSFVPEEKSLKAVAEALGTTVEYLKTGTGDIGSGVRSGGRGGGGGQTQPNVHKVRESIRELLKLPEVLAYRALVESLEDAAQT